VPIPGLCHNDMSAILTLATMKFLMPILLPVFLVVCCSNSCDNKSKPERTYTYKFSEATRSISLPKILNEISGLVLIDSTHFACIQDEKGMVFIYDLISERITREFRFADDGDFEGIAKVGADLYVLRSDGELFHVVNFLSDTLRVEQFTTGVPADNNEGLCYDSAETRLLIGCKSKIGAGKEYKDIRAVYEFDLNTRKLNPERAFEFYIPDLIIWADSAKVKLPVKEKKSGEETALKFRTSAIAIHPVTGNLHLLSASDHMYFEFRRDGKPVHMELMEEKKFNKPEGICFYRNGNMLITNEAQDKKPTLYLFNYNSAQ
jgi:SdiA-regulated